MVELICTSLHHIWYNAGEVSFITANNMYMYIYHEYHNKTQEIEEIKCSKRVNAAECQRSCPAHYVTFERNHLANSDIWRSKQTSFVIMNLISWSAWQGEGEGERDTDQRWAGGWLASPFTSCITSRLEDETDNLFYRFSKFLQRNHNNKSVWSPQMSPRVRIVNIHKTKASTWKPASSTTQEPHTHTHTHTSVKNFACENTELFPPTWNIFLSSWTKV